MKRKMQKVKPKKYLGQHFLNDLVIAKKITELLSYKGYNKVLEIGAGMGVLTQFLINEKSQLFIVEIDHESISYIENHFPKLNKNIIQGDFLKLPLNEIFQEKFAIIGNFPYNISSQILFKSLEHKDKITEIVGMFQKEVAERITSNPGSKKYGILSVIIQAYYEAEYIFTVDENVFSPIPKVKSAVIRLIRKKQIKLSVNDEKFKKIVKIAFRQRRKTLRNALKSITLVNQNKAKTYLGLRAEQLSVDDFIELTKCYEI